MPISRIYRHWLSFGLLINAALLCLIGDSQTALGPVWVWLIAIPLGCLSIVATWPKTSAAKKLPQAVRRVRNCTR